MITKQVRTIGTTDIMQAGVSPANCIRWVEESFRTKYESQLPAKVSVHPQDDDFFTSMPALLPRRYGRFGIKVVSRIAGDAPALKSDIMLYSSESGQLLAVFDGDWITAMRTGAVAALSIRLLKGSGADTCSIVGLGNTARAVALCLLSESKGETVRFRLLRYKDQAWQFIERFKDYPNAEFEVIDTKEKFFGEASVIVSCVTSAKDQLLCPDDSLFQEGVLLVPVHTRGFQNCDLFFDKVFGDDTAHIQGFRNFSRFRCYDELSQVLLGYNPGRENDRERIISYNVGLGLHDVLFASKLYDLLPPSVGGCFTQERESDKFWM